MPAFEKIVLVGTNTNYDGAQAFGSERDAESDQRMNSGLKDRYNGQIS